MCDRTSCVLYLMKEPTKSALQAIIDFGPTDSLHNTVFYFNDVNHGEMPDSIDKALARSKNSFVWFWGSGSGYEEGVCIYDADEKHLATFACIDQIIHLSINQVTDEDTVAYALVWDNFMKKIMKSATKTNEGA